MISQNRKERRLKKTVKRRNSTIPRRNISIDSIAKLLIGLLDDKNGLQATGNLPFGGNV